MSPSTSPSSGAGTLNKRNVTGVRTEKRSLTLRGIVVMVPSDLQTPIVPVWLFVVDWVIASVGLSSDRVRLLDAEPVAVRVPTVLVIVHSRVEERVGVGVGGGVMVVVTLSGYREGVGGGVTVRVTVASTVCVPESVSRVVGENRCTVSDDERPLLMLTVSVCVSSIVAETLGCFFPRRRVLLLV